MFPDWEALKNSWARVTYEPLDTPLPEVDRFLSTITTLYENSGEALFGRFELSDDSVLAGLAARGQADYWEFPHHFLSSRAVRSSLPQLNAPESIPRSMKFEYETSSTAFGLGGELAHTVYRGGLYEPFRSPAAEAMDIGAAAADAITERRYGDFISWRSHEPWSPWFSGVLDFTLILLDRGARRVSLLCLTETD